MKPLIVIFLSDDCDREPIDKRSFNKEFLNDYHILFIVDKNRKVSDVKVFSDKNIKPIDLEKLKNIAK